MTTIKQVLKNLDEFEISFRSRDLLYSRRGSARDYLFGQTRRVDGDKDQNLNNEKNKKVFFILIIFLYNSN